MSLELTPEREREETLAYLEFETPRWVDLRNRATRAGNMNGELNRARDQAMSRIDYLLDDLFSQTVILELTDGAA